MERPFINKIVWPLGLHYNHMVPQILGSLSIYVVRHRARIPYYHHSYSLLLLLRAGTDTQAPELLHEITILFLLVAVRRQDAKD